MSYAMREISSPLSTYVDRFPSWALDNEDKKKARKGNIVSFTYGTTASWQVKYNGGYLLFPKYIELDTEITILNPSPIYKKTTSLRYSCVLLTVKSLLKNVYCPVEPEFFKNLYLYNDKYKVSPCKKIISGKFALKAGFLYLGCDY